MKEIRLYRILPTALCFLWHLSPKSYSPVDSSSRYLNQSIDLVELWHILHCTNFSNYVKIAWFVNENIWWFFIHIVTICDFRLNPIMTGLIYNLIRLGDPPIFPYVPMTINVMLYISSYIIETLPRTFGAIIFTWEYVGWVYLGENVKIKMNSLVSS